MYFFFRYFLYVVLILRVSCSTGPQKLRDLSAEFIGEIIKILLGELESTGQCPPPQTPQVDMLLYKGGYPHEPIVLDHDDPSPLEIGVCVIILIHGWMSSASSAGILEMKDAYLRHHQYHVITIDWSELASKLYTTSFCEVPKIGELVAQFLCLASEQVGIVLDDIDLVGHSLGAHISGFIGKHTVARCGNKIGKIIGLDPAGPLFQGLPTHMRLDKSDAWSVQVIHTNELMFGYWGNVGYVDFHVNCGKLQPGCPKVDITNITESLLSTITCSHLRSIDLFIESINSTNFIGRSCPLCPIFCDFGGSPFAIMGDNFHGTYPDQYHYYVPTREKPPYAKGCEFVWEGCL